MEVPVKYAVAVVLRKSDESDEFLLVKRPDEGTRLSGLWGLPAVTMKEGELPEDAAHRVCEEKLNCEARIGRFLGIMFQRRDTYNMHLMDVEMILEPSETPDVSQATTDHVAYSAQEWTDDLTRLIPAAERGSCCSSILLNHAGLMSREDWVTEF